MISCAEMLALSGGIELVQMVTQEQTAKINLQFVTLISVGIFSLPRLILCPLVFVSCL
jgi:hypothetical protein